MKRVLISGYYGFNNAGDEAILAALIVELKKRFAGIEITVLSANPQFTTKAHQVAAVKRTDLRAIKAQLNKSDLLISGGGSLLQDVTGNKTIAYYLGIIVVAKLMRVPVFFCGQGVGPVNNLINQKLIAVVLNRIDLITVRDKDSKKLLQDLGVKEQIKVTADLVFNLKAAAEKKVQKILEQEQVELSEHTMVVSVRGWEDNSYVEGVAAVVDKLIAEQGVEVILLPLKYPADHKITNKLEELLANDVQVISGNYKPEELIGVIARCDLMLGVRLHSLVFAAVAGVPVAGISYDSKVDSFLAQLGLEAVTAIDNFNQAVVYDKLLKIWQNREQQRHNIEQNTAGLRDLAADNVKLLCKKLGD
ncbi:MAG: polysaccharide pyruvyl transferase CsaB [Bacillota bacterium]